MTRIQIAQDPTADAVLSGDPFALVVGMLLDQQFPMGRPRRPGQRCWSFGTLDPGALAAADPESFADLCATLRPSIAMADRWPVESSSSPTSS